MVTYTENDKTGGGWMSERVTDGRNVKKKTSPKRGRFSNWGIRGRPPRGIPGKKSDASDYREKIISEGSLRICSPIRIKKGERKKKKKKKKKKTKAWARDASLSSCSNKALEARN